MRTASIQRDTLETQIALTIDLDGRGESSVSTGCGFLDHMLTLFARHGRFDLTVSCHGDHQVDDHHTVEDVGSAWAPPSGKPWATSRASAATAPPPFPWMRR